MKIGNMEIGYLTDAPKEYTELIRAACNVEGLRMAIEVYLPFASDAMEQAQAMTDADWPDYLHFDKIGRINGSDIKELGPLMERFGAIMLPEAMMKVTMVAHHFGAPWGCVAIRMAEEGYLKDVDGIAVVEM